MISVSGTKQSRMLCATWSSCWLRSTISLSQSFQLSLILSPMLPPASRIQPSPSDQMLSPRRFCAVHGGRLVDQRRQEDRRVDVSCYASPLAVPNHFSLNHSETFTSAMSAGTSTSGPMTAAKASPESMPKTATATAMASSKLLLAAVKESVADFG
jgi:hypothetical protein